MAEIRIENAIPESDPRRLSIQAAIEETLRDHVGTWSAEIRPAQTEPWWVVVVKRTDGDGQFKTTLLIDPRDESPSAVREVILASLKGAV